VDVQKPSRTIGPQTFSSQKPKSEDYRLKNAEQVGHRRTRQTDRMNEIDRAEILEICAI
jgi:hypothetical protein